MAASSVGAQSQTATHSTILLECVLCVHMSFQCTMSKLQRVNVRIASLTSIHVVQRRISARYIQGDAQFSSIEMEIADSGREGTCVASVTITAEPQDWEGATRAAVQVCFWLLSFSVGQRRCCLDCLLSRSDVCGLVRDNADSGREGTCVASVTIAAEPQDWEGATNAAVQVCWGTQHLFPLSSCLFVRLFCLRHVCDWRACARAHKVCLQSGAAGVEGATRGAMQMSSHPVALLLDGGTWCYMVFACLLVAIGTHWRASAARWTLISK